MAAVAAMAELAAVRAVTTAGLIAVATLVRAIVSRNIVPWPRLPIFTDFMSVEIISVARRLANIMFGVQHHGVNTGLDLFDLVASMSWIHSLLVTDLARLGKDLGRRRTGDSTGAKTAVFAVE